jgi:hypothetical protein
MLNYIIHSTTTKENIYANLSREKSLKNQILYVVRFLLLGTRDMGKVKAAYFLLLHKGRKCKKNGNYRYAFISAVRNITSIYFLSRWWIRDYTGALMKESARWRIRVPRLDETVELGLGSDEYFATMRLLERLLFFLLVEVHIHMYYDVRRNVWDSPYLFSKGPVDVLQRLNHVSQHYMFLVLVHVVETEF